MEMMGNIRMNLSRSHRKKMHHESLFYLILSLKYNSKMAKKIEKNNFVYSTNPNFEFEYIEETIETLLPEKQLLKVLLDTKQRAGKKVTIIEGFIGNKEDLYHNGSLTFTSGELSNMHSKNTCS